MKTEWHEKLLYKYNNRVRKPPPPPQEGEEEQEPEEEEEIGPDDEVPIVPYRKLEPTASEFVINNEGKQMALIQKSVIQNSRFFIF